MPAKEKCPDNADLALHHNSCIPHADLMRSIEVFFTKVLPRVSDTD
ncbi:MAG: hypothetical protein V3V67_01575 [Myxococcota bacterium]